MRQDVAAVISALNQYQFPVFKVVKIFSPWNTNLTYESLVFFIGGWAFFDLRLLL